MPTLSVSFLVGRVSAGCQPSRPLVFGVLGSPKTD